MLLSDVIAIVFSVLGVGLAFQGLWLLAGSLWARCVQAAGQDCQRSLWKPLLCGVPIAVAAAFAVIALGKLGSPGGIAAVVVLSLFLVFSAVGIAGFAALINSRLRGDAPLQFGARNIIMGGLVLELAFLFPLAGWFFVMPLTLIIGVGAAARALFLKPGKLAAAGVSS